MSAGLGNVCRGSGLNPSRYPTFADHQRVECHKCGQVVRVFQRYYDGPRDVRNLALEAHAKVSGADGVGGPSPGATTDTARTADTVVGTPPPNTQKGE